MTGTLLASAKARKSAAARAVQVPPPTTASGRREAASSMRSSSSCPRPGCACAAPARRRVRHAHDVGEHVLGQRQRDRAGPARAGGPEGLLQQLGQALGLVDLRHPLADLRQEAAVVDLLERLAVDHLAADLADQHHHRRRVLERDVQPRRPVRRAGRARDEADAGAARELAVGLRHHRGSALLPRRDEADRAVRAVQRVEHREVALAGDAEHEVDALRAQAVDQHLPARPRSRHGQMPPMQRYLTSIHSSMPYFEPSRPMPDSLTPPNGETSLEMKPVLMPTMPVSRPSATRQMRPMSRE